MNTKTRKTGARLGALLLSLCLMMGLAPMTANAAATDTGKAIQAVNSGLAPNLAGGQADNIYFGAYKQSWNGSSYNIDPIKWQVLNNGNGQLFLISDRCIDIFKYHEERENVTWETSTIRSWLNGLSENAGSGDTPISYASDNFIGNAFSAAERTAILDTAVVNDDNPVYKTTGGNNTIDKIFLLSIEQAQDTRFFADDDARLVVLTDYAAAGGTIGANTATNPDYEPYQWWLRSPGYDSTCAAHVRSYGEVSTIGQYVNGGVVYGGLLIDAVRPAFNLDLGSVLFTSAAEGGKASGADALTEIGNYDGNEWKLTLKATNRNFTAATTAKHGDTLTVSYSGAVTGANEYVSVMVADYSGSYPVYTHYGRIAQLDGMAYGSNGTVEIDLSGIDMTGKTLHVFNEQYNGDYKTDYASSLVAVENPAEPVDPEDPAQEPPAIIKGVNATWQKGNEDGLSFTSNAAFADFIKVQVDGKDLDASCYTVKEGSTIVTLNAAYLESLSVGKHTISIVSATGTAATEFTITATQPGGGQSDGGDQKGDNQTGSNTDPKDPGGDNTTVNSPKTGDNSNLALWFALLSVSCGGVIGTTVYSKKKREIQ